MAGIRELVAKADGDYYTISEVAKVLGKDVTTVKRWQKKKKVNKPTHKMPLGKDGGSSFVWLYTEADIAAYKSYSDTVRVGRPRKEENGS